MIFTLAAPSAPGPLPLKPKARLAPLGKFWREYTSSSVYEVVKAVTADGEWMFEREPNGTWSTGHLPTETVVKVRLRSLGACQAYVASGKAAADLKRIQAKDDNERTVPGE